MTSRDFAKDLREISRFHEDFEISQKISGFHFKILRFHGRFQDLKISRKISLEMYEISASDGPLDRSGSGGKITAFLGGGAWVEPRLVETYGRGEPRGLNIT